MSLKRALDLAMVLLILPLVLPLLVIVAALVKFTSRGPAIYWSTRIGKSQRAFLMPKFRTMKVGTPAVATHLLNDARSVLTPIGGFLRATSVDELPQLWSVLKGDMSFVGPRPALFNQYDLIALREQSGVNALRPGITGWAQVNGRDDLPIDRKVNLDVEYIRQQSFAFDLYILFMTLFKVLHKDGVHH